MKRVFQWILLILLAIILIFAVWEMAKDFGRLRQFGPQRPIRFGRRWFPPQNTSAAPSTAEIRSWMTFRYINTVFKLPQDYLKNSLAIDNAHYPNLSIDALGKEQKKTSAATLAGVVSSVQKYISDRGPASPAENQSGFVAPGSSQSGPAPQ